MSAFILMDLTIISLIIFLLFRDKDGGLLPATLKTVTSLLFVGTAIAAMVENMNINGSIGTTILLAIGLIIFGQVGGLIGDLTLDLKITYAKINPRHSDFFTYVGMGAFAIGHIAFIVAVSLIYGFSAWTLLIAAGASAAIICISMFVLKMKYGKFLIPTCIYAFLLTLFMACTVAAGILTTFNTSVILLTCGAGLFLLSDLVLSMTYFDGRDGRTFIIINHVLYYAAQICIALSIMYI